MHSSGQETALPQNTLSGVGCVVFSVAVNVLCHFAVPVINLSRDALAVS